MDNTNQTKSPSTTPEWLKTLSIGFAIVSFGIAIGVIGFVLVTSKNQTSIQNQQLTPSPTLAQPSPTPIDETANWKTYRNEKFGFEIKYLSEGNLTDKVKFERGVVHIDLPSQQDTNLKDKFLEISGGSIGNRECSTPVSTVSEQKEMKTVNDIRFTKEIGAGAAAGTRYETISYSTQSKKQNCISLIFGLTIANIQNYDPTIRPKEFDREKESEIFDQILSTFKFTDQNQTSCNTNSDCKSGEMCTAIGPIVANQSTHKVCVTKEQAVPL